MGGLWRNPLPEEGEWQDVGGRNAYDNKDIWASRRESVVGIVHHPWRSSSSARCRKNVLQQGIKTIQFPRVSTYPRTVQRYGQPATHPWGEERNPGDCQAVWRNRLHQLLLWNTVNLLWPCNQWVGEIGMQVLGPNWCSSFYKYQRRRDPFN